MSEPKTNATLFDASDERWSEDVAAAIETTRRLKDARHVAVMPDIHLARGFCVGTVLATRNLIYPSAVGGDIGCGMLAAAFDAQADAIDESDAQRLLALLPRLVPWNRHPALQAEPLSNRPRLSDPALDRILRREGRVQLGTLGRGNHFLELQRDISDGRLWLMVHTGSRGLGQAISSHHLAKATPRSFGKPYLEANSDAGRAYLSDHHAARAYARLNRLRIAQATAYALDQLIGARFDPTTLIQTDHNHVRREIVHDRWHWVHRKGAAPAHAGVISVVPGSMAAPSFHVLGRGHKPALCSCAHGAGRRRDRSAARRHTPAPKLIEEMRGVWFNTAAVTRLTDEAPSAYKDVRTVMRKQRRQVQVIRELRPVLSYKGV